MLLSASRETYMSHVVVIVLIVFVNRTPEFGQNTRKEKIPSRH